MNRQMGFSLIELAIVLVIVTLLVGGLAMPLTAQIQARRMSETRVDMQAIHDALIGYAMSHYVASPSCTCNYDASGTFDAATSCTPTLLCPLSGSANSSFTPVRHYLPCPDAPNDGVTTTTNDGDGIEETRNVTSGNCPLVRGVLPWATMGLKGHDAWGNRYTYAVTSQFANDRTGFTTFQTASNPPVTPPTPPSSGDLNVFASSACGTALISSLPVIVISHGANGRGAQNVNGGTPLAAASVPINERLNLAGFSPATPCTVNSFVTQTPTANFDDLVIWVSSNELFNRVCQSGGCP